MPPAASALVPASRAMLVAALVVASAGCSRSEDRASRPDAAPAVSLANAGRPAELSPEMRTQVSRSAAAGGDVFLLGEISGRRFYRIESSRGERCFSVGDRLRLGAIDCPRPAFPSPKRPVLDLSIVELSTPETARVVRLEGLAADGVDTIRLVNASGAVIVTTPVVENLYALTVVPDRPVVALVARDASGRDVARISYVGGA